MGSETPSVLETTSLLSVRPNGSVIDTKLSLRVLRNLHIIGDYRVIFNKGYFRVRSTFIGKNRFHSP